MIINHDANYKMCDNIKTIVDNKNQWTPGVAPVAVVMITLNEAHNMEPVLENLKNWAQEIFLVDSYSMDNTVDIALRYGVHVVQRKFRGFGDQWNYALRELPINAPWTMKLDPDERLSDKLKESLINAVYLKNTETAYSMNRRLWFMGKPLHVTQCITRIWKTGKCSFSNVSVNEHPLIDGSVGMVDGLMEHLDSKDLHHWVDKQNRYTTMLAIQKIKGAKLSAEPKLFGTTLERRMFFVHAFFLIPFRYQLQFIYELFARGAWRDGKMGLRWARLRVESRRLRELKIIEIENTGKIPEIPMDSDL